MRSLPLALLALLLLPAASHAAITGTVSGTTVTVQGNEAADALILTNSNGNLAHNQAGFNSSIDWDSTQPGDQSIVLNGQVDLTIKLGAGNDSLATVPTNSLKSLLVDGEAGDDVVSGSTGVDTVNGGDGDDKVSASQGGDTMTGGAGDDLLIWNNGEGSDKTDGNDGFDVTEINGAPSGETATIAANGARTKFDREAPGAFSMDMDTEVVAWKPAGGDDKLTVGDGVPAIVRTEGGSGNDTFAGAGELDSFSGGSGNDVLTGGGGADVLDGDDGDDQLFARDGVSDVVRCGAGNDAAQLDTAGVEAGVACEAVDQPRPPVVTPTPSPTPGPPSGLTIKGGQKLTPKGRTLTIPIECQKTLAGCVGSLEVVTRSKVKSGRASVVALLGTAKFNLGKAPGIGQPVKGSAKVTLPANYATLARARAKELKTTIVITNTNGLVVRVPMVIRLPKPKKTAQQR